MAGEWTFDAYGNTVTAAGRNRITEISRGSSATSFCVYDVAGNLVFDGSHAYQYDAWNRLVQVYEATPATGTNFDVVPRGH